MHDILGEKKKKTTLTLTFILYVQTIILENNLFKG